MFNRRVQGNIDPFDNATKEVLFPFKKVKYDTIQRYYYTLPRRYNLQEELVKLETRLVEFYKPMTVTKLTDEQYNILKEHKDKKFSNLTNIITVFEGPFVFRFYDCSKLCSIKIVKDNKEHFINFNKVDLSDAIDKCFEKMKSESLTNEQLQAAEYVKHFYD